VKGHAFFETLSSFPKPLIAAINGTCLGGGLELALVCHFRILSDRGMVGLPEIDLGLLPGLGGTQRLPRLIGESAAMEMILTGATINPEQALARGIVHKVVPRKEVLAEAVALAKRLQEKDKVALRRALRAVRASTQVPLPAGLELERTYFSELWERVFRSGKPLPTVRTEE
jgi:enoyl-CoA hydratase/carnithine racemase